VIGGMELTPVALAEGMSFARRQFGKLEKDVDYDFIPTAVFCQPNIGTVGFTESEAQMEFGEITLYKSTFRPMKHTISGRDEKTFMKLIVDDATDRVVGVHMMGPDAGEIMQGIAIALKAGATKATSTAPSAFTPRPPRNSSPCANPGAKTEMSRRAAWQLWRCCTGGYLRGGRSTSWPAAVRCCPCRSCCFSGSRAGGQRHQPHLDHCAEHRRGAHLSSAAASRIFA
jgi:hypothetical protein